MDELPDALIAGLLRKYGGEEEVRAKVTEVAHAKQKREEQSLDGHLPLLPSAPSLPFAEEYDFVIIGSGSAGAVLAASLAALLPELNLLLVEAGPDEQRMSEIDCPAKAMQLTGTKVDWQYKSAPQQNACFGFKDCQDIYPRGRVLGGSSCINYHAWVVGLPEDYNNWENSGCVGWSWHEVEPHFAALVHTWGRIDSGNGPIEILAETPGVLGEAMLQALADTPGIGRNATGNFNDGNFPRGGAPYQGTISSCGRRSTSARCFLHKRPPNLSVRTDATVNRLLFSENTCVAVELFQDHESEHLAMHKIQVAARKEVIVSCGAIASPQLLQISGIGPRHVLESIGIPQIVDLPVGENLQDHLICNVSFVLSALGQQVVQDASSKLSSLAQEVAYELLGAGPLTGRKNPVNAQAFFNTRDSHLPEKMEGLQFSFLCGRPLGSAYLRPLSVQLAAEDEPLCLVFVVWLLHPSAKGTVRLKLPDPSAHPSIDPNFLSESEDLEILLQGIRMAESVATHPSIMPFLDGVYYLPETVTPSSVLPLGSDTYWRWYVRHFAHSGAHPIGTCCMGDRGVLDSCFRVRGVNGLRVVDASSMPEHISGNINAACMMVGRRGAHFIANEYKQAAPTRI